jgi:ribosomal protein S6--L-glutamate ligase
MLIAVISRIPELYTNRRLLAAARERGADVRIFDPLAPFKQGVAESFDAVIPRFGPIWQSLGGELLAQLQASGAVCLNSAEAVALARDKPAVMQVFGRLQLPMPPSVLGTALRDDSSLAQLPFPFPMLIKEDASAGGWGIHRVEDAAAALAVMARLNSAGAGFTLQAFIAEAAGRDLRVFVCGGRVLAAMCRTAPPGEFRANVRLGARAEAIIPDDAESALALAATAALGLTVAGVDLLRTRAGPLLLEVNAAPGFEALEAATGQDIAGQMLDLLISRTNGQNGAVNNQIIR